MIWLYGLGGAFMYAGPRLIICLRQPRTCGVSNRCWLECVVSLVCGTVAVGYVPFLGHYFGKVLFYDEAAFAITVGLVVNKAAPKIVSGLTRRIERAIRAPPARKGDAT